MGAILIGSPGPPTVTPESLCNGPSRGRQHPASIPTENRPPRDHSFSNFMAKN